jgi:hypothetical protein
MIGFWILLAGLACIAGIRYWRRMHSARGAGGSPHVDDEALRRILETGSLPGEDDDPLDMDAAARAEEEFWRESWDEPEEYSR